MPRDEAIRDRPYLLALARLPAYPAAAVQQLLAEYGSFEEIFHAARRACAVPRVERLLAPLRNPDWRGVEADLRWAEQPGNSVVGCNSASYPQQLREIPDAPPVLFLRGDVALLSRVQLAIVGSRRPSADGRRIAAMFAAGCAERGIVVTSGMALGIDAAAHRGTLEAGGHTIAVLGSGLCHVYPTSHRSLAEEIVISGLLVSEFPCDERPYAGNFPRRNRIISGLSAGVLVVEAGEKSGSLITARLAAEQGREVFAVPGCIRNPVARGCHRLIRDGAKLAETIDDVIEEVRPLAGFIAAGARAAQAATTAAKALDASSKLLLDNIGYQPVNIDFLIEATTIPAGSTASILSQLEIAGLIEALPGGNYVRR